MTAASILWRRLDTPGHDACSLQGSDTGWRLEGTAVFREDGAPVRLTYQVDCDLTWRTRRGAVQGWLGHQPVGFRIARTAEGGWTLNDAAVPGLEDCLDLDLGFTPATNLIQLRRLELTEGQAADAPAAWLDLQAGTLERLPQRYERRTQSSYGYQAPSVGYEAALEVGPDGFIRVYPGLWEAESS